MGNPAWGHGYHEGFGDGAKQGGVVGALITLSATGLIMGGKWAVGKIRELKAAKQLARDPATETPDADEQDSQPRTTD